jgi:hypothetical protein
MQVQRRYSEQQASIDRGQFGSKMMVLQGDFSTTLALSPVSNIIPLKVNRAQANPGTPVATLGSR